MCWPSLRFEKFYEAFQKRKTLDELNNYRMTMIGALYGNSNYDGRENSEIRQKILDQIDKQFDEAIKLLYAPHIMEQEEKAYKANPFFKAVERGLEDQGVPALEESLEKEPKEEELRPQSEDLAQFESDQS